MPVRVFIENWGEPSRRASAALEGGKFTRFRVETGLLVDFVDFSALLSLSLFLFVHVNDGTPIKMYPSAFTKSRYKLLLF